jgi:hypothetical protein
MVQTRRQGPTGYRPFSSMRVDACRAVKDFLVGRAVPEKFSNTIIVLILKVNKTELLSQIFLIILCNILYKIASKVMANRLKIILPFIISEEQSAFVPGQLITQNVL